VISAIKWAVGAMAQNNENCLYKHGSGNASITLEGYPGNTEVVELQLKK
jgi:hypothetical protein